MCFSFPPYFDHDAFMNHTMHVLDAPVHAYCLVNTILTRVNSGYTLKSFTRILVKAIDVLTSSNSGIWKTGNIKCSGIASDAIVLYWNQ